MGILKGISKYIIILLLGILLAFFVAWIQYDTQDLAASVLSITEQDFFESTKWDAWYKKENQIFEVFLAQQVRNQWPLTISILFSPENFQRFIDQIDTNYSITNIENTDWNLILKVDWFEEGDLTEWIFQLPYSWDSKDVTLEYIKSDNLNFAIWNLDNVDSEDSVH